MIERKKTRQIKIGDVAVGGGTPVSIQSMTNTDTRDTEATIAQIQRLEAAGCEIVRCAVVDENAAKAFRTIRDAVRIPLIADIHFDYKLAIASMEHGADAIRINPGNIGSAERVRAVVDAAKANGSAIRVGVNAGSLEKDILKEHGITAEALVKSAFRHIRQIEEMGFYDMKISLKASSVPLTYQAYTLFAAQSDYPLHIGVTEAGTFFAGTVKSSAGIGALLLNGIGDTLRVSLTGDPEQEIRVAWQLLNALEIRRRGPEIISCPTCGRTEIGLEALAVEVEKRASVLNDTISIAVMGCPVNGPGEAKHADYGIAGGRGLGIIFKKGEAVKKVPEAELVRELFEIIKNDGIS
ncbi:flavodoxin-dependent (E)-4-hydroxy-3-methylbut-2-enyl-diphosphate synthase [Seleniivibrio woodruffii]|uniref:4-hydroxy-3-methylbut-2-en-1-yl diphosphate synthase (flavodoxin) n=1 Tax=Seleniivibrio woodruffii TaxID=1078050 RepID=A0A4R1KET0_9BACT|nr:flavodoxin-dependent (E)-4-hydroxy-3-methylbut-2-enyl-diphosphate synthase [Seleniivibrio woodruffii]TCK62513.1 4-hydroxy-3-methylbut-2-en-1-yl diphosphate synthase [Seleniivibrio woodruffii]TVZ37060.1 4-hydroxy-3-methylbut-2-en-1-yl diphosphate synthase [Seleniivibrio woodruffii]